MLSKKVCENCGKTFLIKNLSKPNKFCSQECYYSAWREGKYQFVSDKKRKHNYTCSYCGKPVNAQKKKKRNGSVADNIFCNRDCYDRFRRLNTDRNCKYCGAHFSAIGPKKNAQFCNDSCRRSYFAQNAVQRCVVCGQYFYPWDYEPSRNIVEMKKDIKTCSTKCHNAFTKQQEAIRRDKISQAFTGERHPNWHGGVRAYRGKNWSRQKRLALIRDNYVCQCCGMTNVQSKKKWKASLEVHHKIPYLFFDGDYIAANDLNNLITLCNTCHAKVEWEYRRKNKNEYQKHTLYQKNLQSIRHRSGD